MKAGNSFSVVGNNAQIYMAIIPDVYVVCLTYPCCALVQEAVQHHGAFFIGYDICMTEEA